MAAAEEANERGRACMADGALDDAHAAFNAAIRLADGVPPHERAKYFSNRAAASLALRNYIEGDVVGIS